MSNKNKVSQQHSRLKARYTSHQCSLRPAWLRSQSLLCPLRTSRICWTRPSTLRSSSESGRSKVVRCVARPPCVLCDTAEVSTWSVRAGSWASRSCRTCTGCCCPPASPGSSWTSSSASSTATRAAAWTSMWGTMIVMIV